MSHTETLKEACSTLPESSLNLLNMFDILQNAFKDHKTEHQSLNYFKNMKTLIMPKQYSIGSQKKVIKKISNKKRLCSSECSVTLIHLKEVLNKFLELPKVFETVMIHFKKVRQS